MFRFRSSTSSAATPSPTSSPFSSAKQLPSTASNSNILSLLQAQSTVSTSSSLSSAISTSTSLSTLPSDPCLTSSPIASNPSEPNKPKATLAHTSTSSPRNKLAHASKSPRRATLLSSPRTSRATTTIHAQPSPTPASRRSSTANTATSEHRIFNTAAMTKKAKVGSAAKSSPFTKPSSTSDKEATAPKGGSTASEQADATGLAAVNEDESNPCAASTPSPSKPTEGTSSSTSESKQNVVVCVRMRPSRASSSNADPAVWNCDSSKNQIVPTEHHPAIAKRTTSFERAGAGASIAANASGHDLDSDDPSSSTYHFQFDKLITGEQTTDDMYHSHIGPVVRAAMDGYNGTVFAYGQTGSGKTHTMSGSDNEPGVIPRAVQQVFQMINDEPDREFLLRVSYLEIYNETLKDLLAPLAPLSGSGASLQTTDRPASPIKGGSSHSAGQSQSSTLRIIEDQKQSRVLITGLREEIVTDANTVLDLIQRGQHERHVGATDWNERSSRSHCVFQLTIESRARDSLSVGKEVRISQLNLIDLAGSERAASQAERRKEGAFINKSLLTLGTVIGKLTEPAEAGDAHIPYRDSKLTRILQTSLSGNARIAVICTLSPDTEHANETLSTLKFGKRCKLVITTAKKGTAMDDKALLQRYRKELDALRAKLEANASSPNPDNVAVAATVAPELSAEEKQKLNQLNQQKEAAQKEVEDMQKKRTDLKGQIEHLTRLILTSQSVAADASEGNPIAGPSTPVRGRSAHALALARRGPRMSDFPLFSSPGAGAGASTLPQDSNAPATLSGVKPFQLEAELAALRRQLRQQIESRQTLITAHQAELAARDARQAELQEAIRVNEEELDEAEVAYDKLKDERDEARKIALKEQEKARENKKRLQEEQEANRLLKLVAKARAGDEDRALEGQIDALTQKLAEKENEAMQAKERFEAELEDVKQALEEQKLASSQAQLHADKASNANQALQAELAAARATAAELKAQVAASTTADSDDDDINAEFQSLVRGKQSKSARLAQLEADLTDRETQLVSLRTELEQTRLELAAKPLPPATTQSADAVRELATIRDELSQSEEERQMLQVELAKLRAAATGREQDAQKITKLDTELARANAKIATLEKEVLAEKKRTAEALNTVARPLPVPSEAHARRTGSVPSSPVKAFAVGGSKLRPTSTNTTPTSGLGRAGSVKEYRRYQTGADSSAPASPSPAALGTRSVLLGHEATFSPGRSNTTSGPSGLISNKAEKEEIERLNAVIASQRAIMADLEKSVASWKERMKSQAELIQKLVVQNQSGSGGQSPPVSDAENEDTFGTKRYTSPRRKQMVGSGGEASFGTLPRTTHLTLSDPHNSAAEPYYGAHTYNRPPLGTLPGSPTKGFPSTFSNNSWSTASPSPLPLPDRSISPSKRKPRKTIEMDLKLLKSSPRVESNKTKFNLDAYIGAGSQDTPTKRRGTNASAYYI